MAFLTLLHVVIGTKSQLVLKCIVGPQSSQFFLLSNYSETRMHSGRMRTVRSISHLRGVYLVPGEGVYLVWRCTWSRGVYLVPGVGCTWSQGGVPGQGGCTWSGGAQGNVLGSGGCTWSRGVCTWSQEGVPVLPRYSPPVGRQTPVKA